MATEDTQALAAVVSGQSAMEAFTNSGNLFEFDLGDFGEVPDIDKSAMDGMVVIVVGLSQSVFQGDYDMPARSLLWLLPTDPANQEPWGMLFAEDSPIIRQSKEMIGKGSVPFLAQLEKKASQAHRGQEYWTLKKVRPQYDERGVMVDPNANLAKARLAAESDRAKNVDALAAQKRR